MEVDAKDKEILFLRDIIEQLHMQVSILQKRIGLIGPKWRLQRNSSVARDQGLQPDLLVMEPDGRRIIVEVCCSNLKYDAENILIEARISGIDLMTAVTPDGRTRKALDEALKKNLEYSSKVCQESIRLLDADRCLAEEFDWAGVLVNHVQETQKKELDD